MRVVSLSVFAVLPALAFGALTDAADAVYRGAIDRNSDGVLQSDEFPEAFHAGATDPTFRTVTPNGVCQVTADGLYFPQAVTVEDGKDKFASGSVTAAVPFGPDRTAGYTVMARIRWDGAVQWESMIGGQAVVTNMPYAYIFSTGGGDGDSLAFGIDVRNPGKVYDSTKAVSPCAWLQGNVGSFFDVSIRAGVWHDIAFVAQGKKLTCYVKAEGESAVSSHSRSLDNWAATGARGTATIKLGGDNNGSVYSKTHGTYGTRFEYMSFRGTLGGLYMWDRALTAQDVRNAFGQPAMEVLAFGRADGTADEFAGVAGATVDAAKADAWDAFPKSFTASDAAATVKFSLVDGSATAFPIRPLEADQQLVLRLADGSSSGAWTVAVNGTELPSVVLGPGHDTFVRVRKDLLKAGENTLSFRYDGAGTASLDRFALGGGWQLGSKDGSASEFAGSIGKSVKTDFLVGPDPLSLFQARMLMWPGEANGRTGFHLYVPAYLTGEQIKYDVLIPMGRSLTSQSAPVGLYLNGGDSPVATVVVDKSAFTDYRFKLPAGSLQAGDNAFVLKNMCAEKEPETGHYVTIDCVRLTATPQQGLMLMVR